MTNENKKKSLGRKLQDFMASYTGKVMLNYAYSWGAAIVILGALFKLTHLPGANAMLFVGMGTEVLVFFISAFDRPYKSYKWESVFPNLKISGVDYQEGDEDDEEKQGQIPDPLAEALQVRGSQQSQPSLGGGTVIIGGPFPSGGGAVTERETTAQPIAAASGGVPVSGYASGQGFIAAPVFQTSAAAVTPGVEVSPEMEEATAAYLDQLKEMTDALSRFVEQTKSMGQDADQINTLNKNLTGINAIYEIQLRSISSQLGTIDQINEQTCKMAKQIDELNTVYARMLEAMTVNMKMSGGANS